MPGCNFPAEIISNLIPTLLKKVLLILFFIIPVLETVPALHANVEKTEELQECFIIHSFSFHIHSLV